MLLTRKELNEIAERERLCEQLAPGPWAGQCVIFDGDQKELFFPAWSSSAGVTHVAVAKFMAASKTDVPALLSHARTMWWMERACPWLWLYRTLSGLWQRRKWWRKKRR